MVGRTTRSSNYDTLREDLIAPAPGRDPIFRANQKVTEERHSQWRHRSPVTFFGFLGTSSNANGNLVHHSPK